MSEFKVEQLCDQGLGAIWRFSVAKYLDFVFMFLLQQVCLLSVVCVVLCIGQFTNIMYIHSLYIVLNANYVLSIYLSPQKRDQHPNELSFLRNVLKKHNKTQIHVSKYTIRTKTKHEIKEKVLYDRFKQPEVQSNKKNQILVANGISIVQFQTLCIYTNILCISCTFGNPV